MNTVSTTPEQYVEMVRQAEGAANTYYSSPDESAMTDDQYDDLLVAIQDFEDQNPEAVVKHGLFTEVAAGVSGDAADVKHSVPMLSLQKETSEKSLEDGFLKKFKTQKMVFEPKLDGIALVARYKNGKFSLGATRGDGRHGEDLTSRVNFYHPKGLPLAGVNADEDFEVRGELYMSYADFEESNRLRAENDDTELVHPRNGVAGSIRREGSYLVPMSFAAYDVIRHQGDDSYSADLDWIEKQGFKTARQLIPSSVQSQTDILAKLSALGEERSKLGYPIDGCTIKLDSRADRKVVGEGSRAPRWAIAFKYSNAVQPSILRDIEVNLGRTGRISLRARFDPVSIDGILEYASVHNPDWVKMMDLRIGQHVMISKNNDIIPQIASVIREKSDSSLPAWVPPTVCPKCGEPWNKTSANWRCETLECSVLGHIVYASKRDIYDWDGFAGKAITSLVDSERLKDIADVFTLTVDELANVPSATKTKVLPNGEVVPVLMGEKSAVKIHASIQESKNRPLARVISSLGIRMLGRSFGRSLAKQYGSMESLQKLTLKEWTDGTVEGIGAGRGKVFYEGFKDREALIQKLKDNGVRMVDDVEDESANTGSQALAGMKVVVTGSMKGSPLDGLTRDQVKELIGKHGGKASDSVSSTTSLLVCGEEGTSKWKKANDLGVTIKTPQEFADMIGM